MDLLTVLTSPRANKSYLADTLASLERAGANDVDRRVVVCDGPVPRGVSTSWEAYSLGSEPGGNMRAFFEVMRFAVNHGAQRLLYFEDDVVAAPNAIHHMLSVGVPDHLAFVTFFDMKEMFAGAAPGLYSVSTMGKEGWGFWGMQAVLYPNATMHYALANQTRIMNRFPGIKHSSDVALGYDLLYSSRSSYGVHVPGLFEHIGEASSIWTNRGGWDDYEINRRATSFIGEAADANGCECRCR